MRTARQANAGPIADLLAKVRGRRKPPVHVIAINRLLRDSPPLTRHQIAQRLPSIPQEALWSCLSQHKGTWFDRVSGSRWTFKENPK